MSYFLPYCHRIQELVEKFFHNLSLRHCISFYEDHETIGFFPHYNKGATGLKVFTYLVFKNFLWNTFIFYDGHIQKTKQ